MVPAEEGLVEFLTLELLVHFNPVELVEHVFRTLLEVAVLVVRLSERLVAMEPVLELAICVVSVVVVVVQEQVPQLAALAALAGFRAEAAVVEAVVLLGPEVAAERVPQAA